VAVDVNVSLYSALRWSGLLNSVCISMLGHQATYKREIGQGSRNCLLSVALPSWLVSRLLQGWQAVAS
jgi:hypothetical protein